MSDDAGLVTLALDVVNQDGRTVCRATVEVLWRRDGAALGRGRAKPDAGGFVPIPLLMSMLDGKKLLITGVVDRDSIAYAGRRARPRRRAPRSC